MSVEHPEADATAPFVLHRRDALEQAPNAETHDHDDPREDVPAESVPQAEGSPEVEASPANDRRPLDRAGRRAARRASFALLLDGVALLGLAGASVTRIARTGAGIPELVLGGIALVLALPCLFAARSLRRVGRRDASAVEDAHGLAQGVAHLRGLFILKASLLFLFLGLGCFVSSVVGAFLAWL